MFWNNENDVTIFRYSHVSFIPSPSSVSSVFCPLTLSLFSPLHFHTLSVLPLISLSLICHSLLPLSDAAHPYDVKVIFIQPTAWPPPRRCLLSSYLSPLLLSPSLPSSSPLSSPLPVIFSLHPSLLSSLHYPSSLLSSSPPLCLLSLPQCMSLGKGVSHQWLHAQTGMIKWQSCPSSILEALKTGWPHLSPLTLSLHTNGEGEVAPWSCWVVLPSDSLWKNHYGIAFFTYG